MNRRRALRTLASLPLLATGMPGAAIAAPRKRLGFLEPGPREQVIEYFAAQMGPRLAELGWIEGRTFDMVWRFGEGEESRFAALAKDIVDAGFDFRQRSKQQSRIKIALHGAVVTDDFPAIIERQAPIQAEHRSACTLHQR